mgnify:CR=1 FL=1
MTDTIRLEDQRDGLRGCWVIPSYAIALHFARQAGKDTPMTIDTIDHQLAAGLGLLGGLATALTWIARRSCCCGHGAEAHDPAHCTVGQCWCRGIHAPGPLCKALHEEALVDRARRWSGSGRERDAR